MVTMHDLNVIEGLEDTEDPPYFDSMQRAINDGDSWRMQGSIGRAMAAAIDSGHCMLGKKSTRDYYGNYIPSRDQVISGKPGSREYVVQMRGEAWAKHMEEL